MRYPFQIAFCLLLCLSLSSQDTLFYRSGLRESVYIKELNEKEIVYTKRSGGLTFAEYRKNLSYIRYRDGQTDSLKTAAVPVVRDLRLFTKGLLMFRDNTRMSDRQLAKMFASLPEGSLRNELNLHLKEIKQLRGRRKVFDLSAVCTGLLSLFSLNFLFAGFREPPAWQYGIPLTLAGASCSAGIFSHRTEKKEKEKRKLLAGKYNSSL